MERETVAGRYRLLQKIGAGGAGEVYAALDEQSGRRVALKTRRVSGGEDDAAVRRFLREGEILSGLDHPNIVRVRDTFVADGLAGIVMELLSGRSLWEIMHTGRLPLERVRLIFLQVLEGLAYAHDRGVVHRDIKPGNIMILAEDRVRLLDFGLAAALGSGSLAERGGSLAYVAPEQIGRGVVSVAADIYSVGALLYHLTTGRPPFSALDPVALMAEQENGPVPPRTLNAGLPRDWEAVILTAMAADPTDRFLSAGAMREALLETGLATLAPLPDSSDGLTCPACGTAIRFCTSCGSALSPAESAPRPILIDIESEMLPAPDAAEPATPEPATSHAIDPGEGPVPFQSAEPSAPASGTALDPAGWWLPDAPESEPSPVAATPEEPITVRYEELAAAPPSVGVAPEEPGPARGSALPVSAPAPSPPPDPAPPELAPSNGSSIRFSAYYPKEVTPDTWHPLHAYAFRPAAIEAVRADAREALGRRIAGYREREEAARQFIEEGAMITARPQLEGFQINPPSVTIGFFEDWHRLDFRLRARADPLDRAVNGSLTFTVEGIIVADIPLSIYVGANTILPDEIPQASEPYDAVFCSYSHSDEQIVQSVERVCRAMGMTYLRDVTTLRSGEEWNDRLLAMIENCDVFQLFWSDNAARSHYVEQEWRHALQLGRQDGRFIRPVYWRRPMPHAPQELSHIHFAYAPELGDYGEAVRDS